MQNTIQLITFLQIELWPLWEFILCLTYYSSSPKFERYLNAFILMSHYLFLRCLYSKTCLKQPLKKKTKVGFQDPYSLYAGQKYCRMLQGEHSAILSTFMKLSFVFKTVVLSIFEWPLKTGFTVALQGEHSAILSTFMKLPIVFKTVVLSIFEWPLKTGFTVALQGEHSAILSTFMKLPIGSAVAQW